MGFLFCFSEMLLFIFLMDGVPENLNSCFVQANKVKVGFCSETLEEATLITLSN